MLFCPGDFCLKRGDARFQLLDRERVEIVASKRIHRIARPPGEGFVGLHGGKVDPAAVIVNDPSAGISTLEQCRERGMRSIKTGAVLVMVALVSVGGASPPALSAPGAGTGLCRPGEVALFSCPVGARTLSVCGGGNGRNRSAQYRFGTRARIEIASPWAGPDSLVFARTAYSGGGELQFSFTNGPYRYVAYSRTIRTRFDGRGNNPKFEDGVFVQRRGRLLSDKRCTGASVGSGDPADYLHEGEIIYPE